MFFVHLRGLSFIWPFREANTRNESFSNSLSMFESTLATYSKGSSFV